MHFIKKKNQEIKLIITYSVSCAKFQFDVNKSGMCVCVYVCVCVGGPLLYILWPLSR